MAIVVTVVIILVEDKVVTPVMIILNSLFISAIYPVCNATIFEVTDEENRSDSLALFMMGMYIGYMLSDLGCAIGFAKYYRLLYVWEVIMKALSICIFNLAVKLDGEKVNAQGVEKKQWDEDREKTRKGTGIHFI